jgi:hypothetical protein
MDVNAVLDGIAQVMPANDVILFSAETGEGVAEWLAWLSARRAATYTQHEAARHHDHRGDHHHGHHHEVC